VRLSVESMPHSIPRWAGVYLAVLQLFFTLCWTVYVIYLPQLAQMVGLSRSAVVWILLTDQVIFTVSDFAMGVWADRASRTLGRLGVRVIGITLVSCAAFLTLPFVVDAGPAALPLFLGLTVVWVVTSSALRAPPLMLIGKYAAKPAIPYLASIATVGIGIAGAVAPYLAVTLRNQDPRVPFLLSTLALVLTCLALIYVERALAAQAPAEKPVPASDPDKFRSASRSTVIFTLAMLVMALGFQVHFNLNTPRQFRQFASPADLQWLMPVFWVGFNIAMFPASLITKRFGGLAVMGGAALLGALALLAAYMADGLGFLLAAQLAAGAAWGCMLMSAFAAAAAIGHTGAEGKVMGLMFSALALATVARIGATMAEFGSDPTLATVLLWTPALCWALSGAGLLYLAVSRLQRRVAVAA
jgi:MFS family permease